MDLLVLSAHVDERVAPKKAGQCPEAKLKTFGFGFVLPVWFLWR